ncbi:MAG: glycoside hydrolase family 127 protein [Lachnospiraceae bacterium]|nr:glycoside hydrolase family 127 protein [Lachnospiraceae bacterium]
MGEGDQMLKKRMNSVPLNFIRIGDKFWKKHIDLVEHAIIPYQWDAMNDNIPDAESSHCIENFKIAAGDSKGDFYGAVFQDTDVAKWLEAVGCSLAGHPDKELERTADEVINLIGRAQQPDGYINTYFTIREPEGRWSNLTEGHELYTAGHLMEAAVAYYYGTGKRKFVEIMSRFADLICDTFGKDKKLQGYPGHPEIELALIRLYYVTGRKSYLETAKYFVDMRGGEPNYFLEERKQPGYKKIFPEFEGYLPLYSQSHLPVREQKTAEGHAVRAVYLYCAMADLAYEYKAQGLFSACEDLWNNIVQKRMYVTGSIGSSGLLERFTTDYDLPNDCNYSETCASIGLALFGMRMAQITRDAKYVDVVERALYNTMLAGIALDGKSFFYVNPLEVWPDNCLEKTSREHVKSIRQKWFGVACCPPNIARTLASLGQYIYAVNEEGVCVNLFIENDCELRLGGEIYLMRIKSRFPQEHSFILQVTGETALPGLWIRVPSYGKNYQIVCTEEVIGEGQKSGKDAQILGRRVACSIEKGYAHILEDVAGKTLQITFDAPATFVRANPNVRADAGRVCVMRGPLVYALEEVDNGANLEALYVDTKQPLTETYEPELFGGVVTIKAHGKRVEQSQWSESELYGTKPVTLTDTELKLIPYPYWNNRGEGEMCVWIKERL